jgi:hypothetical protein
MVDMHDNVLARNGDAGRDHIPAVPFWMAIIRAFQFVCDCLLASELARTYSELTYIIALGTSRHGPLCIRFLGVWRRLRRFLLTFLQEVTLLTITSVSRIW